MTDRVVLANATVATLSPPVLSTGTIVIEDGLITAVGDEVPEGAQMVDCSGRLVMPGNVCAHTHLYSALARGMPGPRRTPRNFVGILEQVWWRLDRALDERSTRYSALVGVLDAVRAGTTSLVDHHSSPNFIDGSLDVVADSFATIGVRGVLCYEVTDRGGAVRRVAGLRENERFLRRNTHQLVRGMVGAHASFTLEDETLRDLAALAQAGNTGVHIHVAEDLFDEEDSVRRSGKRTAQRLADAGILRPQSISAHGVHLEESEIELIQRQRSWLVHNCRSNMNNSVGRAPVTQFGPRAALGTDGIDGDMFAESRTAFFRAREGSLDAIPNHFTDLLAAGGEMVSQFFPYPIGTLEPGAAADLMILNYDPPTPLTAENLLWHWMFAFSAAQVESVMVGGSWVLRHGEFVTVDEERIRAEARQEAVRLWERMQAL